jgi:hypothetical protein
MDLEKQILRIVADVLTLRAEAPEEHLRKALDAAGLTIVRKADLASKEN